jgi:hypothetical protein
MASPWRRGRARPRPRLTPDSGHGESRVRVETPRWRDARKRTRPATVQGGELPLPSGSEGDVGGHGRFCDGSLGKARTTPPLALAKLIPALRQTEFRGGPMSLSNLASIRSFISGVAVVITLVFLLIQTRQTHRNQKALMQQGRSARSVELLLRLSESYQSDVVVRAERGDITLTASEARSYFSVCGAFYWNYEDSFLQFQRGTLDGDSWAIDLAALRQFALLPSARVAWTFVRNFSGGPYVAFVDNLMHETSGNLPPDPAQIWQSQIRKELAEA